MGVHFKLTMNPQDESMNTDYLLFGFPGNQELFKLTQIMHPVDQNLVRPLQ